MSSRDELSVAVPLKISVSVGPAIRSPEMPATEAVPEGLFGTSRSAEDVFAEAIGELSVAALHRPEFSWEASLATALCSYAAYQFSTSSQSVPRRVEAQFETFRRFARGNTEGFVASTDTAVVVAFRGTQQLKDWLTNLNVGWKTRPYGNVHRGFYFGFQVVRTQAEQLMIDAGAREKRVILTGHSLGGALATIGAAEWLDRFSVSDIYTFGQPAVGFSSLRNLIGRKYGNNFTRFVNDDDIVPRVPPGFRHVGKLFHFKSRGRLTHESAEAITASNETPTMTRAQFERYQQLLAADRVEPPSVVNQRSPAALTEEGLIPSVSDHGLDRYADRILRRM